MNKSVFLLLGAFLSVTLRAADIESEPAILPIDSEGDTAEFVSVDLDPEQNTAILEPNAPPFESLNVGSVINEEGIGIRLKTNPDDDRKSRISWSVAISDEAPLEVLGSNYFFIPARHLYQQKSSDETGGKYYIDIILAGKHPERFFNNRVAATLKVGQRRFQIPMRLLFENDDTINVQTQPTPHQPVIKDCNLATDADTGKQTIMVFLRPFKETYFTWKMYFQDQYIVPPRGEDTVDRLATYQEGDATPLALFSEMSIMGEAAAMQTPMYDYVSSPIDF